MSSPDSTELKDSSLKAPDFKPVQTHIRRIEAIFLSALEDFDKFIEGEGNEQYTDPVTGTTYREFTGAGLCYEACLGLYFGLKNKFGERIPLKIIEAKVVTLNHPTNTSDTQRREKFLKIMHARLEFTSPDGDVYFIDPTYGQINKRINRIILGSEIEKPNYYLEEEAVRDVTKQTLNVDVERRKTFQQHIEDDPFAIQALNHYNNLVDIASTS